MQITNNVKDIIVDAVDRRLAETRERADRVTEEARHAGVLAENKAEAHIREVLKRESTEIRKWLAKNVKGIEVREDRWDSLLSFSSSCIRSKVQGEDARRRFDDYRHEVIHRALRVASENPSRTAYAEVDKFLAGINPARECGI
jgi:hypothetical protein